MEEKIKKLQELIDEAERIVFMGGAGVSTESGIPDFRGKNGIYHQKKYENVFDIDVFYEKPEIYYNFYYEGLGPDFYPNEAHKKLAELEMAKKLIAVITQNIDGLHEKAGSKNVIKLHGSSLDSYCSDCKKVYPKEYVDSLKGKDVVPRCSCGGLIRPDVVFFGEQLKGDNLRDAVDYINKADLLIVGGSSLTVFPAAGLVNYYNKDIAKLVIINIGATPYDSKADLVINEKIGEIFSKIKV